MIMENRGLIYSGFLLLPPVGKILLKKSWQQKFCMLFKSSKCGIERLEIYDNVDATKNTPSKILTLENCIKITSTGPTNFSITTKSAPFLYEFSALSTQLKNEWVNAFQTVAFPDDVSLMTSIQEDNDLYCSSGEPIFNVRIHPSPASERCGLNSNTQYILLLTSTAIHLKNLDGSLLYTWPYCFIRRYGYKSGKFTFEAGRKCDSGEGTFFLEYSNQQEIFRCLALKMKSMKKLLMEESSGTILDCGDNQFHAALNMEARSRSPLPPSPTTSTSLHDIDPNISTKTQSTYLESAENSFKQISPATNKFIIKPKPIKPPRKTLGGRQTSDSNSNNLLKTISDYEPIDKYDRVEYRSDAWRTLGVDDIKHTENIDVEDEEDYMSWSGMKKINNNVIPVQTTAPKIFKQTSVSSLEDNSYDKLNFFGSSGKLNLKSGYKQVSLAPAPLVSPPSFNDYDEVQPAMEGVRLADDSHLGYALVRKDPPSTSNNTTEKDEKINHHFHNNEPYAVISKPKRV